MISGAYQRHEKPGQGGYNSVKVGRRHTSSMRVTIENINPHEERRLGCTQLPSFPTEFISSVVTGTAWFVPASGDGHGWIGQALEVEINQEKVSGFEILKSPVLAAPPITALPQFATFRVRGLVGLVTPIAQPEGEQMITVQAGEALFTFTKLELGGAKIIEGIPVAFTVHDLSLWDEAI